MPIITVQSNIARKNVLNELTKISKQVVHIPLLQQLTDIFTKSDRLNPESHGLKNSCLLISEDPAREHALGRKNNFFLS